MIADVGDGTYFTAFIVAFLGAMGVAVWKMLPRIGIRMLRDVDKHIADEAHKALNGSVQDVKDTLAEVHETLKLVRTLLERQNTPNP